MAVSRQRRLRETFRLIHAAPVKRRLRILKYPWQTAHDYELAKLPHEFFYLSGTYRRWAKAHRPLPENIRWAASPAEVNADVMILHLDQWSFHEPSKRALYLELKRWPGPKITIIHGCNLVDGCTASEMASLTADTWVVCNSSTAHRLWALPKSRFILHGMSADEWPLTSYARSEIVMVQPATERHAATRNDEGIRSALERMPITWIGKDVSFRSFDEYRNYLGQCSIFFNPSFASANPRARTEAMLMGLAVVTTASHGEAAYIRNGENGFCSNDFSELLSQIERLLHDPASAKRLGAAGRATAQQTFSSERFLSEWETLLDEIISERGVA
ncbi:MAG: glycosyltransferase family 4 protein [Bdellovibrionales bacterium]|nr:glycosyltransferase family 4 protein [Bdellovibrionales bacterium]